MAYIKDFDGGSTYIPSVHPHADMSHYRVLGSILAHGFVLWIAAKSSSFSSCSMHIAWM